MIQVLGAYLDDMTITGSLGQDHRDRRHGESWQQASQFLDVITSIMEFQSRDATRQAVMHRPAIFSYPPKNWRFQVYVKALTDPDGGSSVIMTPGKLNQRYTLTLFIVQEASTALVKAGSSNGVFSQKAYDAISAYMARISAGIGWHFTQYNGQATGTLLGKPPPRKGPGGGGGEGGIPHPH